EVRPREELGFGVTVQARRLGYDPNERLAMVGFAVDPPEILRRDGILQEGVTCREDSPDRLDGVTREGDLHPGLLLDLGRGSMTFPARTRNSDIRPIDRPCGIARKRRSHGSRSECGVKVRSVTFRRFGWARPIGLPAIESDVTWATSTFGCRRRSRSNSPPVYPEPPTIPTFIASPSPQRSRRPWQRHRSLWRRRGR